MKTPDYPAFAHMRAYLWRTEEDVKRSVMNARWIMGASDGDITLTDVKEEKVPDGRGGFKDTVAYRLEWHTYAGWRVYMFLTGALTPRDEPKTAV